MMCPLLVMSKISNDSVVCLHVDPFGGAMLRFMASMYTYALFLCFS